MGSKGTTVQLPQAQNNNSSVTPNPVALAAYSDLINRAQGVSSTAYQPYGGGLVQGFSPQQQQAFNEVGGLQGAADPYIQEGRSMARTGATAGDPSHFGSNIGAYESPYTDQVVNATMANINETNAQQQNSVVGNAIAKGAMGGDRLGVAQAELARQQNLSNNQTLANLRNEGFKNASQNLFQGAQNSAAGAYSMGALGNEAQSTGLQGANALLQTGGLQQQLGQANLSTAYQQFLNQQAYPFQNLSWLSGIVNGTGPNMGQTSTSNTQGYTSQLAPSPWNAIMGGGVAAAGLFAPSRTARDGGRINKESGGGLDFGGSPYEMGRHGYVPPPVQIHTQGLVAPPPPHLQNPPSQQGNSSGSTPNFSSLGQAGRGLSNLWDSFGSGSGAATGAAQDAAASGLAGAGGLDAGAATAGAADAAAAGLADAGAAGAGAAEAGGLFASLGDFLPLLLLARGGGVRGYDDGGTVADDDFSGGLGALIEGRSVEPRSTRNNNPGNLEDNSYTKTLPGYVGGDGRFARFDTPENGAGAQDALLQSYGKRGFNTPAAIVGRWAPAAENGGDSTNAYVAHVAKRLGVDPNSPLDMNDPQVRSGLRTAMADYEAGTNGQTSALSYDGAAPKSGGLGAIEGATSGSGNGLGAVTEGRSADDGTAQSSDGLGGIMDHLRISPDTKTALIAAGLGMMASPSHWVGQAIGAGGLEGVKAYQTAQKTGIAQQTANQSGENIKSEIATRKGQLGISQQAIEQRAKELGIHLEQVRNQGRNIDSEVATRAAGLRETRFVPGVGWQLFDKANPDKGWQVISGPGNPAGAPQATSPAAETGTPAPAVPSAPAISAAAAPPPSSPAAEPQRGAAGMMNWKPTTGVPQGYVPQNHMAIYSNPEQVKHEGEMANKAIEQNRTDARNAMPVLYRLDEMDHAIDNLPKTGFLAQGTGANERAQIAKTGNTVAQFFHLPNIFDESKIASIENLNKDTFRLGAELSRQIGGREPGFIVQQAVQANPGVENTAAGYRRIVSGLREAARYQQDRNSFMDDYYGKFGHLNGAEDAFAKANSPQKYVDRAVLSTIDPRDAQVLQKHPDQAKAFDGLYGKGSAQLVLGQGAP